MHKRSFTILFCIVLILSVGGKFTYPPGITSSHSHVETRLDGSIHSSDLSQSDFGGGTTATGNTTFKGGESGSIFPVSNDRSSEQSNGQRNDKLQKSAQVISKVAQFRWYEDPYDMVVIDDMLYLVEGSSGLRIINVSDPSAPVLVNRLSHIKAHSITIRNNFAFLLDASIGLTILNITNPLKLVEVTTIKHPSYEFTINKNASLLFMMYSNGFSIFNISSIMSPVEIGQYETSGAATGISVSDDMIYLTFYYKGFEVIDISTPTTPTLVGSYTTISRLYGVQTGTYTYIIGQYGKVDVFNTTDPANITLVAEHWKFHYLENLIINGSLLYAVSSSETSGFRIMDISNISQPVELMSYNSYYPYSHRTMSLEVHGNYVYQGYSNGVLSIVNITDPNSPEEVSNYNIGTYDMTVQGNYAYVAAGTRGIRIVQIDEVSKPRKRGEYFDGGKAIDIEVRDNLAFVADGTDGIEILDISDPNRPVEIGQYDDGGYARSIDLLDSYLYVADDEDGVEVIDISDPSNPIEVWQYQEEDSISHRIILSNSTAYVAVEGNILWILDTSDPANPNLLSTLDPNSELYDNTIIPVDLAVQGSHVYIALDATTVVTKPVNLIVVDVSDPINPLIVGYSPEEIHAQAVVVKGDFAILSNKYNSLFVLDISDPTNLTIVARFYDKGEHRDLTLYNQYLYVSNHEGGFGIYEISIPQTVTSSVSQTNLNRDTTSKETPIVAVPLSSSFYLGLSSAVGMLIYSRRRRKTI